MDIKILQLLDGAKSARGLTVIIDVFRAFTVACYLANNNADKIIPVGDIQEAYKLKDDNPGAILIGERNERKPEGFDFGNCPSAIKNIDFTGKTVIHTTSSGTQGIVAATGADEIITGSFVNADAIVRYIHQRQPKSLSLVCMGYACQYPTDEDTLCAAYIRDRIQEVQVDMDAMRETIRVGSGARFFLPENQNHAPSTDFDLCTLVGVFDFVLRVEHHEKRFLNLRKIFV